jgi:hypothetical protein
METLGVPRSCCPALSEQTGVAFLWNSGVIGQIRSQTGSDGDQLGIASFPLVPHGPNYISKYTPYALLKRFILPCHAPAALHYTSPSPSPPMSSETRRLLEAAMALSQLLSMHAIPHAFHGSVLTAVMSDSPRCDVCLSLSFAPSSSSSTGDLLHRRGWPHAPFPPRPSSGRKQRIFHHDTFTMEQSVEALPLDMSLPSNPRLHSLHATYRRFIPAVEVSSHLFEARAHAHTSLHVS